MNNDTDREFTALQTRYNRLVMRLNNLRTAISINHCTTAYMYKRVDTLREAVEDLSVDCIAAGSEKLNDSIVEILEGGLGELMTEIDIIVDRNNYPVEID